MKSSRTISALVMGCFFASGAAGLVYQVVWARYLALFLGHTSYAVIAVLASFMGGLALGNAWFGRRADRSEKPLALYGWLELGIALYAIAFPVYYELCHAGYINLARSAGPGSAQLLPLKFGFALLTVLLPATLMGATFPVLSRFVTGALAELRRKVAALYTLNSAGAVAGVIAADFFWIPSWGLEVTIYLAAILNIVAGVVALGISFRINERVAPAAAEPEGSGSHEPRFTAAEIRLAILAIGVSGFVAMLYEVAWTRLLALVLGSSTHAFSLMLITFITGIALGSYLIYRWQRLRRVLETFAWAEVALGVSVALSMFAYGSLPYWFARLGGLVSRRPESYAFYELAQMAICFAVMLIPTICLGTTLPLASRIATTEVARTGRSVGAVFSINTIGTVLGTIVTGLILMPWLGLARTFALGAAANIVVGALILLRRRRLAQTGPLLGAGAVLMVFLAGRQFDSLWQHTLTLGLWRDAVPPPSHEAFRKFAMAQGMKYYRDGAGATVNVYGHSDDGHSGMTLKVNGKADAGTGRDVATQLLTGHIPLMLKPDARRVLVVGLGSGMTAGATLAHPAVEHTEIVEITPEVVEAARLFGEYNDHVLDNSNVSLWVEDAKSFLQITPHQYDVIISEPSNPWMAGVAGVFTREYYLNCQRALTPGGIVAQWVQTYETSDETLSVVLRTFGSVFPFVSLWEPAPGDLVMIGSIEPRETDLAAIAAEFDVPKVRESLARVKITSLPVLLALEVVTQQNGLFLSGAEGPIHTDYVPVLEYMAQKAFFVRSSALFWQRMDEQYLPRPATWLGRWLEENQLTATDYRGFADYYITYERPAPGLFRSLVLSWERESPETAVPVLASELLNRPVTAAEWKALELKPRIENLIELAADDPEPLRIYAGYAMEDYRKRRSVFNRPPSGELTRIIERLIETDPTNRRVHQLHLAEIAFDAGEVERGLSLAQSALELGINGGPPPTFSLDLSAPTRVVHQIIETLFNAGRFEHAMAFCTQATSANYHNSPSPEANARLLLACRKVTAFVDAAKSGSGMVR